MAISLIRLPTAAVIEAYCVSASMSLGLSSSIFATVLSWEFLFLAANIDAVETAERYGIRRERAANYNATKEGTDAMYACMSMAVESIRNVSDLDANWADGLNK